jgi:hypothetical protein
MSNIYLSLSRVQILIIIGLLLFLSLFGLFSPIILGINPLFSNTILADTLQNSILLKIIQGGCIATTIPMAFEIFLDVFGKISITHLLERSFFLFVLLTPSIIFFSLNDNPILPFLYIVLDMSKTLSISIVIIGLSYESISLTDKKIFWAFLTAVTSFCCSRVLRIYYIVFPLNQTLSVLNFVFFYPAMVIALLTTIYWSYKLYNQSKSRILHNDEYKSIIYIYYKFLSTCQRTYLLIVQQRWRIMKNGME